MKNTIDFFENSGIIILDNSVETFRDKLDKMDDEEIKEVVMEIKYLGYDIGLTEWYDMEDFDSINEGLDPYTIASKVMYGNFNPGHRYFSYDGYENFKSCDYINYDKYDLDDIAEVYEDLPDEDKETIDSMVAR